MICKYSVIQYVPDPVRNERVNVGVIVWSGNIVKTHFISDWRRIKDFFNCDLNPNVIKNLFIDADEEKINSMVCWGNSIQLSHHSISLCSIDQTLDLAIKRFLS